jgi:uncharacterized membrane protein YgdD (TMEM256/DUF423 family)
MNEPPDSPRAQADGEHLEDAHLPALLGRMLDDLVRIGEAQTKLFEANISAALSAALDRALGRAISVVTFLLGGLCLLGAIIVLLQRWLPWWQALALTGAVLILAGWLVQVIAARFAARRERRA